MGDRVCVISIYVPSLEEAINFYTNTIGFKLEKYYGPKIASLVHKDLPIILEEHEDLISNHLKTSRIVLALNTNNIYNTANALKTKGVKFIIEEPSDCPPGKYISFYDPFGNILEYIQFENA